MPSDSNAISRTHSRVETAVAGHGRSDRRSSDYCESIAVLYGEKCSVTTLRCHDQLEMGCRPSLTEGRGLVIYEYQEGRGIGFDAKFGGIRTADAGLDTVRPSCPGVQGDCRNFRTVGRDPADFQSNGFACSRIIRAKPAPW